MQVFYSFILFLETGKAITKPKNKNTNPNDLNDLTKTKHQNRTSAGNIYDSIMGQIQSTQQDYIKNLINKNQRESIKNQRQSIKQPSKNPVNLSESKKSTTNVPHKNSKGPQSSKKIQSVLSHERTKSQAQLLKQIVNQNQFISSNIKTEISSTNMKSEVSSTNLKTQEQKQITQISCERKQPNKSSQLKMNKNSAIIQNCSVNPIIEALNNTSSSFAKKLESFQLEYPNQQLRQQRQQRSTHKKGSSKLAGNYFSCQPSPKNTSKHSYTKEVVITTKPQINYNNSKTKIEKIEKASSATQISPITSTNKKSAKKYSEQPIATSFLSCLDQYLEALNTNQGVEKENIRYKEANVGMKRGNRVKQYSSVSNNPFTLGKQDQQQQQTIVLQTFNNQNLNIQRSSSSKLLTLSQQQKLIRLLQQQRKKNLKLQYNLELLKQCLSKQQKKQRRLKQNQLAMVECLKSTNQQLNYQKREKRKLQEIVKQFETKIRGISRGKDKQRQRQRQRQIRQYQCNEDQHRPQRKTIYGTSSVTNSIHYNNRGSSNFYNQFNNHNHDNFQDNKYKFGGFEKNVPSKIAKHSKKNSSYRFSSMINNINQDYSPIFVNQDIQCQNHYPQKIQKRSIIRQDFGKNRTQKINKISSFEFDTNYLDEEQNLYSKGNRNSAKNIYPSSCKNSNYMNSSVPVNKFNSRPVTPKLINQLFNGASKNSRKGKNSQHYEESEDSQTENAYDFENQLHYKDENRMNSDSENENELYVQNNSLDNEESQQQSENRLYHDNMLVRMR